MVARSAPKRSLLKDKAKTTPQFREAFTGPTCLYRFLSERPQRFLTRNLTYMVQARKKRPISGKIEMHKYISLNDLYNRRIKEEQQRLTMKSSKLLTSTTIKSYRSCVKSEEEALPVTFIFRVVDCDIKQMVKGFICPWCNRDYLDSRTLFYHLSNNHVHLKFGTKNGKNVPSDRIIVTVVNEEHSDLEYFSLVKSEGVLRPKSFAFPIIQNSKPIQLPLMNFYHSQSFMPFTPDDSDGDSDEEMCTHWIQQTSDENLDELPELNNSEKLLMKMWNRHIEPYRGLGDCHLPEVCLLFAKNRATEIASFNLRNNFVLHLMTLAQYQMIDVTCTTRCLGYVDRAIDSMGTK
ncbi:2422_t:CDS:2 [Ambispora leptoticha]|uniref:2422_t:CDS:1 n=1 Tax=Ambispora leptoticha TaxID=144679 RepID=A0A9N8VWE5_9GLOM|nr:2422_t:CDS:2 [Ambispora leptoticha]